jgi:predicted DNA-binding ribbon-helix-helix protein
LGSSSSGGRRIKVSLGDSEFEELRRLAKERGSSYSQLIGKANDVPSQGGQTIPQEDTSERVR